MIFNDDIINNNKINSHALPQAHESTILGTVSGKAQIGDVVKIEVNGHEYTTQVNQDKTFSINVDNNELLNNQDHHVHAKLYIIIK